MSTEDVPGANPVNGDKLARACWAEHQDGSMIFVKDIDENDRVIFEMYDFASPTDPVYYPHALAKSDFEKQFSFKQGKGSLHWTWHDKTPFPWEKVMKLIKSPTPGRPAEATISAARKVADSLRARGESFDDDHVDDLARDNLDLKELLTSVRAVWKSLRRAIKRLDDE